MHLYIVELKRRLSENPPRFDDGDAILTMLYESYSDADRMDDDRIKTDFHELYQAMRGMPLKERARRPLTPPSAWLRTGWFNRICAMTRSSSGFQNILQVSLPTDCLINKERKDIAEYPRGSFVQLMQFFDTL